MCAYFRSFSLCFFVWVILEPTGVQSIVGKEKRMHTLPFKFITIKKLAEKKKRVLSVFFFLRDVDELTAKFADLFLSTLLYIYILYSPIFFPAPTFSLLLCIRTGKWNTLRILFYALFIKRTFSLLLVGVCFLVEFAFLKFTFFDFSSVLPISRDVSS